MSLTPDDQCITSMLVQAQAGVETIHEYLKVDKRTIAKHIKRHALAAQSPPASGGDVATPIKTRPLPKEVPAALHRIAEEFVRTRDEQHLDEAMETLDHPSAMLLIRHIAQLLEMQGSSTSEDDEEDT